jgi:hypothetical protein
MSTDDVITEWFIDGAWTRAVGSVDLDERVRKSPGVRITRGVSDQQSQPTPATSDFEVNNTDGIFSNRNPTSDLYGKIPRYTLVRHRIPTTAASMDSYVRFFQPDLSGTCSTPDAAGLEITGDIDIRFEITPDTWAASGNLEGSGGFAIAGRYNTSGGNRSWHVWLDSSSRFNLRWSTNGTAVLDSLFDAWPHETYGYGRQCMRITLDVDNGAGGWTATLYHATSISASWTQIQQITGAGVTSIYGLSNASLDLGAVGTNGSPILGHSMMYGKFHAFELRNGINGTLVASLNATEQEIGATSWADPQGNTWTLSGTARIGSDRIRHTGEMDVIDYRSDETGNDVWLPLRTQGALGRLQVTGAPLRSPLFRVFQNYPATAGYWPMEEASGATKAASVVANPCYAELTGCSFTGAAPSGLAGSAGSIRLDSSTSKFKLGASGRIGTGENTIVFCFKLGSLPASDKTLLMFEGNGTARRWDIQVSAIGFSLDAYDNTGTQIVSEGVLFGAGVNPSTSWVMMQLTLRQEGANVRYYTRWAGIGTSGWYTHFTGGETYAGTVGLIGRITADASVDAAFTGAEFAHVVNARDILDVNTVGGGFYEAAQAWVGERSAVRATRLAEEEGIELEVYGGTTDSQLMGVQSVDTVYNLINDCAKVDAALLFDVRDRFVAGYRTRVDMESGNGLYSGWNTVFTASTLAEVPAATEDGRYTVNDFTATRSGGGYGRAIRTDGPLSIEEPPDGIGYRPGGDGYNAYDDDQIQSIAEYQLFLRTQDEMRIPSLKFEIHRRDVEINNPNSMERIIAATPGDWLKLFQLPTVIDPAQFKRLLVLGYSEQFDGHLWNISFNVVSADGQRIVRLSYDSLADNGTTELKSDITSSATSVVIRTPVEWPRWVDSTNFASSFPIAILVGGEFMSMTALTTPTVVGGYNEQTATVVRSENFVVKAQTAGTLVELLLVNFLGLES